MRENIRFPVFLIAGTPTFLPCCSLSYCNNFHPRLFLPVKKVCLLWLALLLFALRGFSATILFDSFNYSNGSLITNSGFLWSAHSGTTGQTQVISGRAQLSLNQGEDVHANLAGAPYSTGNLYASFTVNFTSLPRGGTSGGYFAHFGSSTFRARIFGTTNGAAAGTFRIGVANAATAFSAVITNNLSLNNDYVIVVRYNAGSPATTIWLNPAAESETVNSAAATDSTSFSAISAFSLRQDGSSGAIGVLTFDNLVVGTTFNDVIPAPMSPFLNTQPQSQNVSAGSTVMLSVNATGSQPLAYQWNFNSLPILGATNSTLILTNVTTNASGIYIVTVTNVFGITDSDPATLTVTNVAAFTPSALSLLTYNVKGNGATNWSTNAPQVQAIGRQIKYLDPDVITFNEIPYNLTYEMTNWITAFLPGYYLVTNSGTDGFIRSAIASRFPITRSKSWLDGADLKPFGYTNTSSGVADNFTRDLFEAQINVPNFAQPLHVFTTHLKSSSGDYNDAVAKRAAEAAAITNFFTTNLFVIYTNDPYVLTGDMNESDTNLLSIQRLTSAASGLVLVNPTNPITGSINTYSTSSANPSERLDYIFPCGLLSSNIAGSQVFRTDRLSPVPPNLNSNDCKVASDHLPVLMVFNNPYADRNPVFRVLSFALTNQVATFRWEAIAGRPYAIQTSTDFSNWTTFATNLSTAGTQLTFTTNIPFGRQYFRVYRAP
jgi:endonuclease/exonuclease/phosphatase family metal-dependent hydrolase